MLLLRLYTKARDGDTKRTNDDNDTETPRTSTAIETSSCASHDECFFFSFQNKTSFRFVRVRVNRPKKRLEATQSFFFSLRRGGNCQGLVVVRKEEKSKEEPRCQLVSRPVSHASDTWWRWPIACFGNSAWPQSRWKHVESTVLFFCSFGNEESDYYFADKPSPNTTPTTISQQAG